MVRTGDLLHTASIVAGATQLAAMIADANGKTQIFSDFYNSTGFCRAHESDQGFDSFKLCFIVDTLYCIFAFLFLRAYPHTDKVKADARELWYGIPGVFFHGMAHLGQYYWYAPGENLVGTRFSVTEGIPQHLKKVLAILFLWAFLSRSVLGNFQRSILSAPVLTMFHYFVIPQKFLFSYVNFTLITLFSLSSLLQEKKRLLVRPICRNRCISYLNGRMDGRLFLLGLRVSFRGSCSL